MRDEHPDRAFERHQALEDERSERERREDRTCDYTPVALPGGMGGGRPRPVVCARAGDGRRRRGGPRIPTAMSVLASEVLRSEEHGNAARALAQMVLEAAER